MAERSEVLRVQNDALLNEYHQLIVAQVRRIDEALAVLDRERNNLLMEKEHLLKHLPQPEEELQRCRRSVEESSRDECCTGRCLSFYRKDQQVDETD